MLKKKLAFRRPKLVYYIQCYIGATMLHRVSSHVRTTIMVKTKVIQEEIETRKMVESAREVLMNRRNKIGEEAYQWIRKRSMDVRKSMRTKAEAVLLSGELE